MIQFPTLKNVGFMTIPIVIFTLEVVIFVGNGRTDEPLETQMINPAIEMRQHSISLSEPSELVDTIFVILTVKALPRGAQVTLHDMEGNILGTATPFGPEGNMGPLKFTIPIPARLADDQYLRLQSQIVLPRDARPRAPNDDELISIEVLMP